MHADLSKSLDHEEMTSLEIRQEINNLELDIAVLKARQAYFRAELRLRAKYPEDYEEDEPEEDLSRFQQQKPAEKIH